MPRQQKTQAASSRAGFGSAGFSTGFGSNGTTGFGASSSSISYLADQPDLSQLSDANITVSFKGLSKKDSTTKARALDDIQNYVSRLAEDPSSLEEAFLDAWVKVYPRAAIDLSRRVRQLAHAIQGKLSTIAGKRMARHMPTVAPTWLAGTHDGDKSVMRTARDALHDMFPTTEKQLTLKKAFQGAVTSYCTNSIIYENAKTLSDERSTSAEDADAIYARVAASSISACTDILESLDAAEVEKHRENYEELVQSDQLWSLFSSKDTPSRRATMRFLTALTAKMPDLVDSSMPTIAKAALSKQAMKHQTGSAAQYVELLLQLTKRDHTFWTMELKQKDSPFQRLQNLVKYGAHSGPAQYWTIVRTIMIEVPAEVFPGDLADGAALLKSIRDGMTGRDELRTNIPDAMTCYFATMERIIAQLQGQETDSFLSENALPVVLDYLRPSEESKWNIPAPAYPKVISNAMRSSVVRTALANKWQTLADDLIDRMKSSLPEQSKEFESSQRGVETQATRFFSLEAELVGGEGSTSPQRTILEARKAIVEAAIDLLKARQGKPYGAASCLLAALEHDAAVAADDALSMELLLNSFLQSDLPALTSSPSQQKLFSVLYKMNKSDAFPASWNAVLSQLLQMPDSMAKTSAVTNLLTSRAIPQDFRLAKEHLELQHFILRQGGLELDAGGDMTLSKAIVERASSMVADDTAQGLVGKMAKNLVSQETRATALSALEQAARYDKSLLRAFLSSPDGPTLFQNLLLIQEGADETQSAASKKLSRDLNTISSSIETASSLKGASAQAVLQRGFYEANENSLAVETLVEYAMQQVSDTDDFDISLLFPDNGKWRESLSPFLAKPPLQSSAVTDALGGVVYDASDSTPSSSAVNEDRDQEGLSAPLRMAMFTADLATRLQQTKHSSRSAEAWRSLAGSLALTAQLANDKLGNDIASTLWTSVDEVVTGEVSEFLTSSTKLTTGVFADELSLISGHASTDWPSCTVQSFWQTSGSGGVDSYHTARAFASAVSEAIDQRGYPKDKVPLVEDEAKSLRRSGKPLQFAAFLSAFQGPLSGTAGLTRIVNETVAQLTGPSMNAESVGLLQNLAILNLIAKEHEDAFDSVAKQRLIFFAKGIISVLKADGASEALQAEICKSLTSVFVHLLDIYGEFWEDAVVFLKQTFAGARPLNRTTSTSAAVPLRHAALKLFGVLQSLVPDEEANDDLKEIWNESLPSLSDGLLNMVKASSRVPDEEDQALRATNELLARLIAFNPPSKIQDHTELFALLGAGSYSIQQTAFTLLHDHIPKLQEDISLAAALDKKTAQLPEELLSLILQAPTLEDLEDETFERRIPPSLLTYLSSWMLIFDHFRNASDQVKSDYGTQLKEGSYTDALLKLIFGFLGVSTAKPVDASKFEPTTYSFGVEPDPRRDARWLLVHLYFRVLQRTPSHVRSWLADRAPRQTRTQAVPWTEKHFSPLVIDEALAGAAAWGASQKGPADERLDVKTNSRTREVRASREIDEQTLAVVVQLPADFPLGQVTVEGANRVAVDERRWRAWLLNTTGVIVFSDNNVAEGLSVLAKNISGQLKGQTECAICYSIVGQDRSLPTKKCQTCKNAFHGGCLYRWFRSSNSSSCPLCRTAFNYA